jgi:SAM-dependent methyltransferase
MYDREFAASTLNSDAQHASAKREVEFIARQLGLSKGARVLDAPCGTGRHLKLFAEKGFTATGIDINTVCLELARKNCAGLDVRIEPGNMADLAAFEGRFDATVNLFSSFGYFATEAENRAVMWELVSTLKPGGTLVISVIDREWLLKVFRPVDWKDDGRQFVLEGRKYDPVTHYNEAWVVIVDQASGQAKRHFHRIRLYSSDEIVGLMQECGLKDVKIFGGVDGSAFQRGITTHPIYFGKKALSAPI